MILSELWGVEFEDIWRVKCKSRICRLMTFSEGDNGLGARRAQGSSGHERRVEVGRTELP